MRETSVKRTLLEKITLGYLLYGRGTVWIGLFWDIVQKYFYLTGSAFFTEYFTQTKISFIWFVWLVPVYYILCFLLGYWDYKKGIWKIQNDLQNRELTPMFGTMEKNILEIKNKIEEIGIFIKRGQDKVKIHY